MKIPLLDLTRLHGTIREELDAAYATAVENSAFIGAGVAAFEDAFAEAHRAPGAAACGSGTDALALTLRVLGVGPGDEVVIPSFTFVATAEAVVHAGATPVIADVAPDTLLLRPTDVAQVRTTRTRAVVPVHLYGHPVPPEDIRAWRESGLVVVEDAAQAHLATHGGEFVGTTGHAACFSFYPGKNLGALGDGGAVISSDPELLAHVRRLRDHGRADKYEHLEVGWCSRLDGVQAAFLHAKLPHLAGWTNGRRELARRYRDRLGAALVPWTDGAVHHLVVVRVDPARRDRIRDELAGLGIGTGIHYPMALSQQPALARWARTTPAAEAAAESVLSLPMDPLMAPDEVDFVCDRLEDLL